MTMDIASQSKVAPPSPSEKSAKTKRSFDVAFLMLPDEKKTRKCPKFNETVLPISVRSDLTSLAQKEGSPGNNNMSPSKSIDAYSEKFLKNPFGPLRKLYDDPLLSQANEKIETPPKSAFSKVGSHSTSLNGSPAPPLSPGQMSCPSLSPPISSSPPSQQPSYPQNFRPEYPFSAFQAINQSASSSSPAAKLKHFVYRSPQSTPSPEIPASYLSGPHFPFAANPFMPQPDVLIRNPATAAILSTLLPTTMSSFSLTAQNICAKCNISFRMTSDLVYHMRSHHKNDFCTDPNRRKREEKLKCSVCSESFRERHHLTRHMTAHQDKEGDLLDGDIIVDLPGPRRKAH